MSTKEDSGKESEEPDYNEDKDQLEEEQEKETGEINKKKQRIMSFRWHNHLKSRLRYTK